MKTYKKWNKIDSINGISSSQIIEELNIKDDDEIFLVIDEYGVVEFIENTLTIKRNYNMPKEFDVEQVANRYLEIIEQEKLDEEKERSSLEEQAKKISILEAENADLLLDSAIKDSKIQTLENDLADLTLEIAMMEVR